MLEDKCRVAKPAIAVSLDNEIDVSALQALVATLQAQLAAVSNGKSVDATLPAAPATALPAAGTDAPMSDVVIDGVATGAMDGPSDLGTTTLPSGKGKGKSDESKGKGGGEHY